MQPASYREIMHLINKTTISSQKGFALIAAVIAVMILVAVGFIALTMSGQDIRISSRVVGEKKAFMACESGIHKLATSFDPDPGSLVEASAQPVNSSNDPTSKYQYNAPLRSSTGSGTRPLTGYAIGGGQVWGQIVYDATVTGTNTTYGSTVQVAVGLGYGPVEITTISR